MRAISFDGIPVAPEPEAAPKKMCLSCGHNEALALDNVQLCADCLKARVSELKPVQQPVFQHVTTATVPLSPNFTTWSTTDSAPLLTSTAQALASSLMQREEEIAYQALTMPPEQSFVEQSTSSLTYEAVKDLMNSIARPLSMSAWEVRHAERRRNKLERGIPLTDDEIENVKRKLAENIELTLSEKWAINGKVL